MTNNDERDYGLYLLLVHRYWNAHLEEILGLEAVALAALEVHLDVLALQERRKFAILGVGASSISHLLEGSLHGVDLLDGARLEGVDELAEDGAVLQHRTKVALAEEQGLDLGALLHILCTTSPPLT